MSSDTLNSICLFLDHQNDLLSLAAAGHRYYEHANSENVWKHICLESWQDKICPPTATISEHLRTLSENEQLNIVGMYSSYWCHTDLDVISQAKIVKLLEIGNALGKKYAGMEGNIQIGPKRLPKVGYFAARAVRSILEVAVSSSHGAGSGSWASD